ncbi:FKBP-type peptidyl-prolyl cis-trans isomerase [Actinokineospora auranticolor]|uniref:Peptidyl-prolyl cis-trans isomerase n=1 Tax=Actinokineospora auranticolor TaxID=155976 RepID=A0A2S6GNE5_9PSEU|nr:FKBP-type peptidyl-prolyl cis-trans isomerase [Actinokineospora auranticolor]PPK66737.1 FKBP-type peptidyl-prolyl isomerase-like protein [Actinokineospora auranticolor]
MRDVGKIMIGALVGLLSLTACANSERASTQPPGDPVVTGKARPASTTAAPTTSAPPSSIQSVSSGPQCSVDDLLVEGAPGAQPKVTVPKVCAPPNQLQSKDLVEGTGPVIKVGSGVQANYELVTWSNGQVADSSFERGQPFTVNSVGQREVIQGWDDGLQGMKQGGRRVLVIPPDKAYGSKGSGPIAPGETLVFVVDAVQVAGG